MHNLGCVHKLDYVHISLFIPNFFDLVFDFTCNTSVLDHFSYICGFNILFYMLVIRLLFHMFKLGFVLCFFVLMHEHAFTYSCINAIGVELPQGK